MGACLALVAVACLRLEPSARSVVVSVSVEVSRVLTHAAPCSNFYNLLLTISAASPKLWCSSIILESRPRGTLPTTLVPFSSSTNNRLLPLHLCRMPVAEAAQRLRGALLLTAERGGERGGERGAQDSQPTSDSPAPTLSKSSSRTSLTTASAAATSPFSGIAADGAQDHGATATGTSLELPIGRGDAEGLWQRCVAGQDASVCGSGGEAWACTGEKPQKVAREHGSWDDEMATLHVDANQMCRQVIGQESEQVWRASLRAAQALVHQQHLQEAEELCVETLTRMVEGPAELTLVAEAQTHLAGVLAKQQRFEESFDCYARAAELYGEVEHLAPAGILRLARVRASMGLVQERMGAMEPALLQYQQALVLYEKHLGSWHARVGGVLVAMAGGCQRLGRRSEALRLYLRALAVFSRALGPEHLVLADVYNHIGSLFAQASHRSSYLKAIDWYYAALLLLMRWRDEHVDHRLKLASQCRRIGQALKQQGRLRAALGWCVRAMDMRMQLLGAQHCAMSCFTVAQLHFQLSNYDAALPLYFQAVECHALAAHGGRVQGETLDVAAALSEMALIYEHKGQYHRAWELALRAADRGRPCSLPSHVKHAEASQRTQVDNMIRKIHARLRTRSMFNNVVSTLRHGVRDWDPMWVPDKDAAACNVCCARFSLLRRRHHCRMCGQVVCASCSSHPRGKRICSACRKGGDGSALARRSAGLGTLDEAININEFSRRPEDGPLDGSGAFEDGAGGVRGAGGEETVRQWLTALCAETDAQHAPTLTIPDFTAEHCV